jgi:hypothetical protein
MKNLKWLLCGISFLFFACDSEINVSYNLPKPVKQNLYVEGYFATIDLKGEERIGTITATYVELEHSSSGDTLKMNRKYEIDKSRGYLKNYMPSELAWRVDSLSLKAFDREVFEIDGLKAGYDSLVHSLPMPEKWRTQLLNPEYEKHLNRAEKHRWEMTHLLKGSYPEKANITEQLKKENRLNFALISIDSVVTEGFQNLDKRKCFTYTVHLTETESFPYYIWEQHVNSNIVPKEFQKYYQGLKAEYKTRYQIAMEPQGGILCQEREVREGLHTMVNPESGDTATFKSNITLERLYTKQVADENLP